MLRLTLWGSRSNPKKVCDICPTLRGARLILPQAGATGPRKLDISFPTAEFLKMVKMWEKYDESSMNIVVRHIKQFVNSLCAVRDYLLTFMKHCSPRLRVRQRRARSACREDLEEA